MTQLRKNLLFVTAGLFAVQCIVAQNTNSSQKADTTKKTMPPLTQNYSKANELKIIVYNKNDFKWAEENAAKVNTNCLLYLQPEWSKSNELMPAIVEYVMNNPKWNISLQTHKYMHIP